MGLISGLTPGLILTLGLLVVGVGIAARFTLKWWVSRTTKAYGGNRSDYEITWKEVIVASLVALVVILPLTNVAVHQIAQSSAVNGYKEFWNGSIVTADVQEYECKRSDEGNSCSQTYECDPHTVMVLVTKTRTVSDGKGGTTIETYTELEPRTEYYNCPYVDREYTYTFRDSLGQEIAIASHIFADNPRAWRGNVAVPGNIARGTPGQWADIKAALDRGDNPPSTKLSDYTNYLLAASDSLLRTYSDKIETYREQGLLADHTRNMKDDPIYDGHMADKVVFVNMDPSADRYREWQDALGKLNAQLGTERQGDLHVLAVPADQIDNPDDYTSALLAYWQSREYGKEAFAKNAIILVVGVSDDRMTVEWARAKTGLPEGNGEMIAALSLRLQDLPFTPDDLLGSPKATWRDAELSFSSTDGAVEQIVLRDYPFLRACMMCNDAGDSGQGYVYLKDSALLSSWVKLWISFVVLLVAIALFTALAVIDLDRLIASSASIADDGRKSVARKIRTTFARLRKG